MITCIINGLAAYPAASQSIKITYANQYVTDDGEYSYDVNFPMSIMANRQVFHNVSRFDVSKTTQKYDDCKLYVSGRLVLSGVGTIISVSESEIKLQIVGGKSRIKYNDKMNKHYIDEIDLGEATPPGVSLSKSTSRFWKDKDKVVDLYVLENDKTKFLGEEGKWCFMPVRDETNELVANFVGVDLTGQLTGGKNPFIVNTAVQPNLMYIFKKVVENEGYTVTRNDFDARPWNLLYIASAYKTKDLRKALPHWTSYTFIEEFRKLFNATIHFDEIKKTCKVLNISEMEDADSTEIKPLDEYTADYDEDGSFSTSSTANLEYNLGNSSNRGEYEVIPQKVFLNFEICPSNEKAGEMRQFASTIIGWSEKRKRQTIIENYQDFYIYLEDSDGKKKWTPVGFWSPLVRDSSTEDKVDLNISPAAQVVEDVNFKNFIMFENDKVEKRCLLSAPNEKESDAEEFDTDEDGYSYVSVQDAIEDESVLNSSEEDKECMSVFFILPGRVQDRDKPYGNISEVGNSSRWPQFMTDYRINQQYRYVGVDFNDTEFYSLSLNATTPGATSLNTFQENGIKIDKKNCLEVKFKSGTIPDPSSIYLIHHKKFVCEKIELEIKDDEIEPIYTGYFYMIS